MVTETDTKSSLCQVEPEPLQCCASNAHCIAQHRNATLQLPINKKPFKCKPPPKQLTLCSGFTLKLLKILIFTLWLQQAEGLLCSQRSSVLLDLVREMWRKTETYKLDQIRSLKCTKQCDSQSVACFQFQKFSSGLTYLSRMCQKMVLESRNTLKTQTHYKIYVPRVAAAEGAALGRVAGVGAE